MSAAPITSPRPRFSSTMTMTCAGDPVACLGPGALSLEGVLSPELEPDEPPQPLRGMTMAVTPSAAMISLLAIRPAIALETAAPTRTASGPRVAPDRRYALRAGQRWDRPARRGAPSPPGGAPAVWNPR